MKKILVIVVFAMINFPCVVFSENLTLIGDEFLVLEQAYDYVGLYDQSRVEIGPFGAVNQTLNAYDYSTVDMLHGFVGGNEYSSITAWGNSTVNIFGGHTKYLNAYSANTINISGGVIENFDVTQNSIVEMTGALIERMKVSGDCIIKLHGYDFELGNGLWLDGNRLMGTGMLGGKWLDGVSWNTEIVWNYEPANILLVPEPTTLLLLGMGGLLIRKRKQ
jgi:hypothetical protein